jgi:sensor c-di-GMP phosphodiesterase-like protein
LRVAFCDGARARPSALKKQRRPAASQGGGSSLMRPRLSIVRDAADSSAVLPGAHQRSGRAAVYQPIVSFHAQTVFGWVSRAALDAALRVLDSRSPETLLLVHPTVRELFDDALPGRLLGERRASHLALVVNERTTGGDLRACRERLDLLRSTGVRIALSELGASSGGLTTFAALEPELVTLDSSFARDLAESASKRRIVDALVSLCRDLGVLLVGDGVESRADAERLAAQGCDLQQGPYYAHAALSSPEPMWPPPSR